MVRELRTTGQIVADMNRECAEENRQRLRKKMNPALSRKLTWIQNWLDRDRKHELESRYQLGLQVQEIYLDETENGSRVYGASAIERICDAVGVDKGLIRSALRFVQVFAPDELARLSSQKLSNGQPLTWTHVLRLCELKDAEERDAALQRTIDKALTADELGDFVQERRSATRQEPDGRGRPLKVPVDFDKLLHQQSKVTDDWVRRFQKVWSGAETSLSAQAQSLEAARITSEHLSSLWPLKESLLILADKSKVLVAEVDRVYQNLQDRQQAACQETRAVLACA